MRFGRLPSHTINRSFRGIPAFFQSKDIADFTDLLDIGRANRIMRLQQVKD
jgi:hypothetical protein